MSTNQFRIWVPTKSKVIITRDVYFNEDEVFQGTENELASLAEKMSLNDVEEFLKRKGTARTTLPVVVDDTLEDEEAYEWQDSDEEERPREDEVPQCNQYDENGYTMARFEPYPTPPETPPQALLSAAFSASTPAPNEKGNSTAKATWEYAFLAGTVVKKSYYAESEPDEETAVSQMTY